MATFYNVPDELLSSIFTFLPQYDRRIARLTQLLPQSSNADLERLTADRRWSRVGAERLFTRLYFAPNKTTMERFMNIVSKGHFRTGIKELVYDARVFVPRMLSRRVFESEYDQHQLNVTGSQSSSQASELISASLSKYRELCFEQQDIIDQGLDVKILVKGLKLLRTNLSTVSVLSDFSVADDFHEAVDHTWYQEQCQEIFEGTLSPARWEHYSAMNYADGRLRWDFGSIASLFQALSSTDFQLRTLQLGSRKEAVPMDVFCCSPTRLYPRHLSCLKIHCCCSCGSSNMAADNDHEYTGAAMQGLQDLLRGNNELHSLTAITGGMDEICPIIRPERWARMLRVLVLEQHSMNPSHLEAFVIASQLQEVRLRDVLLEPYHSNRVAPEWVEIAHRMGGQLKKLQYVQLVRIIVGTSTSPLDEKACRSKASE